MRVLDEAADGDRLRRGEVLVTTVTNVGWTPLFPRLAAVVTDVGAPLSHAAIVARELGIPAVVGCGNATMRLRTGDRVRVDGSAGTVEVLSSTELGREVQDDELGSRRPVEQVAPELLGAVLRHGDVAVRLTEVEAYDGANDPASHAFRGRTPRNEIMFGPPGHLYVYFSYGMHWAANIICGPDGVASGVLLRAGEVIAGLDVARSRRGRASDRDLARGPGRLTQALGIGIEHKGACLLGRRAGPARAAGRGTADDQQRPSGRGLRRGRPALAVLAGGQPVRLGLQAQPARPGPGLTQSRGLRDRSTDGMYSAIVGWIGSRSRTAG